MKHKLVYWRSSSFFATESFGLQEGEKKHLFFFCELFVTTSALGSFRQVPKTLYENITKILCLNGKFRHECVCQRLDMEVAAD